MSEVSEPPRTLAEAQTRLARELGDTEWRGTCPVCTKLPPSPRAAVFAHMLARHGLDLGDPARLVDVPTLLATMAGRLAQCRCLCCERQFPNQTVLRKHMKHKRHYRLSLVNPAYQRFFLASYEPTPEGAVAPASSAKGSDDDVNKKDAEESERDEEDDEEDEGFDDGLFVVDAEPTRCLFCETLCESAPAMAQHCAALHGFDLAATVQVLRLSFYDTIKLVNYIRHCMSCKQCPACGECFATANDIREHLAHSGHSNIAAHTPASAVRPWASPQFLLPQTTSTKTETDPLLYSLPLCGCVFADDDSNDS